MVAPARGLLEKFRVCGNGRVGIGTESPRAKLDVYSSTGSSTSSVTSDNEAIIQELKIRQMLIVGMVLTGHIILIR